MRGARSLTIEFNAGTSGSSSHACAAVLHFCFLSRCGDGHDPPQPLPVRIGGPCVALPEPLHQCEHWDLLPDLGHFAFTAATAKTGRGAEHSEPQPGTRSSHWDLRLALILLQRRDFVTLAHLFEHLHSTANW